MPSAAATSSTVSAARSSRMPEPSTALRDARSSAAERVLALAACDPGQSLRRTPSVAPRRRPARRGRRVAGAPLSFSSTASRFSSSSAAERRCSHSRAPKAEDLADAAAGLPVLAAGMRRRTLRLERVDGVPARESHPCAPPRARRFSRRLPRPRPGDPPLMPEGDTLHKVAAALRPRLVGHRVLAVETRGGAPRAELAGKRGWRASRRSASTSSLALLAASSSARISGCTARGIAIWVGESWRRSPAGAGLVLRTAEHVFVCFAPREVEFLRPGHRSTALSRLGPDLLGESVDWDEILDRARGARHASRSIAELLLRQDVASRNWQCLQVRASLSASALAVAASRCHRRFAPARPFSRRRSPDARQLSRRDRERRRARTGERAPAPAITSIGGSAVPAARARPSSAPASRARRRG